MHGLKDGVGEVVGLLLVSILGTWTVSQLQCHNCIDYRYTWHVVFPSTLALRWPGPMALQAVALVTSLVSSCSQTNSIFYHFPWHLFSSPDIDLQLVGAVHFRKWHLPLPLPFTKAPTSANARLKALLRKSWEGVVPFLLLVSKYSFHSKKFRPRAAVPHLRYDCQFPIPTRSSAIFCRFSVAFSPTEPKCIHKFPSLLFQSPFSTFSS